MSAPEPDIYEAVKATLLALRYQPTEIPPLDAAGVYALFLTEPTALAQVVVPASGLLYIGMTDSSLDVRNHFAHRHSGFSSPRRSLGAVLKAELGLRAIPRSAVPSPSNITSYRFPDDGEQRLTDWMHRNLVYALAHADHDVRGIEHRLILELEPPLNLTDWRNPQKQLLRALRNACRQEARAVSRGQVP